MGLTYYLPCDSLIAQNFNYALKCRTGSVYHIQLRLIPLTVTSTRENWNLHKCTHAVGSLP